MVALNLTALYLVALLFLSYVGYGPTRLLVRGRLGRFRLFFLPLLGLCTAIVLSSFLNSTLLPMGHATWAIVGLATALNLLLVLRTRTLGIPGVAPREMLVAIPMLGAYILGVLPLLHANTLAFLGVQWDLELYLPLTEYLKRYAVGDALRASPNPLIDTLNSAPVRGGSGWGFSYVEAILGTLLGWPSFETFRPTLQLVFSLSMLAVYLFCRGGLRLGTGAALLTAVLAGLNGLNLWIASIGLAGHTVSFVTLPLALWVTKEALEERTISLMLLAGLVVAAMLLSFYTGSLVLYGVAAGALGLVSLVHGPHRGRLLLSMAGVAAATFLLGLIAHLRFLEVLPLFFRQGFSEGWRVQQFSPISQALGLTPYALVSERVSDEASVATLVAALGPAGTLMWASGLALGVGLLILVALSRRGWQRGTYLTFLFAFAAFAAYLRWGSQYPYGYFKLLSLTSFLLLAGLSQGLVTLWRGSVSLGEGLPVRGSPLKGLSRTVMALYALGFLPLLLGNTALSIRYFWERDPQELPRSVWELHRLEREVPPGAAIYLTGRPGYNPRIAAMIAYFLLDHSLVGNLKTAYGQLRRQRPDEPYQYLLLQSGERPEERGLRSQDLVWQHDLAALYRRPQAWLTAVELEGTQNALPIDSQQRVVLDLTEHNWSLTNGRRAFQGEFLRQEVQQQVELSLLISGGGKASLRLEDREEQVQLPPGLVNYRTRPFFAPTTLQFSLEETQQPAWLLGLRVLRSEDEAPTVSQSKELLLLQPRVTVQGTLLEFLIDFWIAESRGGSAAVSLEVYRKTPLGRDLHPEGFWQLVRTKGEEGGRVRFFLDLASWRCGTTAVSLHSAGPFLPADGAYEAHLAVYYVNEEIFRRSWLTFALKSGRVEDLVAELNPPYSVSYLPVLREVRSLRQALPAKAQVYVPPVLDPDDSFLPVAVALLGDRDIFTEDPTIFPRAAPRMPGAVQPYGLLPSREPPEHWGFSHAQRLWANDSVALYRRSERSPFVHFQFWSSTVLASLAPGEELQGRLEEDRIVLVGRKGGLPLSASFLERVETAQGKIVGVVEEHATLVVDVGSGEVPVKLTPGVFEYWTPSLAPGRGVIFRLRSLGPGDVRITTVELYRSVGESSGLRPTREQVYLEVSSSLAGNTAHVELYYFGPRPENTVLGLDIYSERPCELMHYGWWATPVQGLPRQAEMLLDLPDQQGRFHAAAGTPLNSGTETWPIRDGTFRAFVFLKVGERFETAPAFEFTLESGRVTGFRPYPVTRLVSLVEEEGGRP